MKLKRGVRIHGIRPEIVLALQVAEKVYDQYGYVMTITSVIDSKHSTASLHYVGAAVDLRIRNLSSKSIAQSIVNEIKTNLGDDFDVVLESNHIHIEFQPKAQY